VFIFTNVTLNSMARQMRGEGEEVHRKGEQNSSRERWKGVDTRNFFQWTQPTF
jgi:hypothetical protein